MCGPCESLGLLRKLTLSLDGPTVTTGRAQPFPVAAAIGSVEVSIRWCEQILDAMQRRIAYLTQ
jgi:hypothetical protein